MAFRIVNSARMQAARATVAVCPAARQRAEQTLRPAF
jgi:hypothetical protein